jgi:hypothetical protein
MTPVTVLKVRFSKQENHGLFVFQEEG